MKKITTALAMALTVGLPAVALAAPPVVPAQDGAAVAPEPPQFNDVRHMIWAPQQQDVTYYVVVDGESTQLTSNSWTGSWRKFNGKKVTIEAKADNGSVKLDGTTSWEHQFPHRPDESLADGDDFNSDGIARDWRIYQGNTSGRTVMRAENLKVRTLDDGTGVLEITTMRHCLANEGDALTDANANPEGDPCPDGTVTAYSSGQLHSPYDITLPKSIETRVRLDTNHHGVTTSVWAHNDQPYCNSGSEMQDPSDVGELNVAELGRTDRVELSAYTTCWYDEDNAKYAGAKVASDVNPQGEWHTFRMDYDGRSIRYLLDGKELSGTNGSEITPYTLRFDERYPDDSVNQEALDRVMREYPWRLLVGAVVPEVGGWAPTVDDSKPFPAQRDLVDYIHVEQWDSEQAPSLTVDTRSVRADLGETATVTGNTNVPGAKVVAEVRTADGMWSQSSVTQANDDGSFEIPLTYASDAPGQYRYRLTVSSPDGPPASQEISFDRASKFQPSISAAPSKPVGSPAYAWGKTELANSRVFTEVKRNDGTWVQSRSGSTDEQGNYQLPLSYAQYQAGTYTYRVGVNTDGGPVYSPEITQTRTLTVGTAGARELGTTSYAWGETGLPETEVFTQVKLDGHWVTSRVGWTKKDGSFTLPLTYGSSEAGKYRFRVGVNTPHGTQFSEPFIFRHQPTASAPEQAGVNEEITATGYTGVPNTDVYSEVLLDGHWIRSRVGRTDESGNYSLPLTYAANAAGSVRYRVVVSSETGEIGSPAFVVTRG